MGCASSAALPFLTNKSGQAVAESPRMNGEPPYELQMVNNKLKENGVTNVKDVNEAFVSEKIKEAVDSTGVQGVIGGVVEAKDEIVNQVKGFGESVSEKVTSAADSVEETIGSAFGKLSGAAESIEEKLKSEVTSAEENVKSILGTAEEKTRAEEIDELLESLPKEEEAMEKAMKEAMDKAVEETVQKAAERAMGRAREEAEGAEGGEGGEE